MFIYSNIVGTFVFNQSLKIREQDMFSKKDLLKMHLLLSEGKELPSEKKYSEKFKNCVNLRLNPDKSKLVSILNELQQFEQQLNTNNLLLTKMQVRESISTDQLIIQVSSGISELNSQINVQAKRLREWYAYVLPELEDKISDHQHFAELVLKDRNELIKEFKIKDSMGKEFENDDAKAIMEHAKLILSIYVQKERKEKYLEKLMSQYCPNLCAVAGVLIGAKLLSIAGSLRKMVMMPASTLQLLGAEKALFRHMTTGARPPRHGVIVNHPIVSGSPQKEHGRRARALADKISMAVKIDFFKGEYRGDKLKKELEEKFA